MVSVRQENDEPKYPEKNHIIAGWAADEQEY
jgi:hypothetical protein